MPSFCQSRFLEEFSCLGADCEDTCCRGWGMQLAAQTVERYQQEAPELLEAVTSGEAEHIMRRDPQTDYCVKFDQGWCGIHRDYGEDFLGDACYFFPRVTRRLGELDVMTASLSCPEVVRLALTGDQPFELRDGQVQRLPYSLRDYLPPSLDQAQAVDVHQAFLQAVEDAPSAERAVSVLRSVSESLMAIDQASWPMAVPFYLKQAEGRLPVAEAKAEDPFNVLHALQGLMVASKQHEKPRPAQLLAEVAAALEVTLVHDPLQITTSVNSLSRYEAMLTQWHAEYADVFQPVLKRWLQAQLAVALYPFAGFGDTLKDRATIIGVRFAMVKLSLMSACQQRGACIDEAETVRVIQTLARFLDHLADPALSMQMYEETGWLREARLRALTGDV